MGVLETVPTELPAEGGAVEKSNLRKGFFPGPFLFPKRKKMQDNRSAGGEVAPSTGSSTRPLLLGLQLGVFAGTISLAELGTRGHLF